MNKNFYNSNISSAISKEIQRFESVHPSIYTLYNLIQLIPDKTLQQQIKDYVIKIESTFVNNQEWTLSRDVTQFRLALLGVEMCGKAALVYRFLTGTYTQEENLDGGRYKKELRLKGQNYLLLIRDEAGPPDCQLAEWLDSIALIFRLDSYQSFEVICEYYNIIKKYRNLDEIPIILVGTQDYINANNPRVIDELHIKAMMREYNIKDYYETCSLYGLGVEKVFSGACERIIENNQNQYRKAIYNLNNKLSKAPIVDMGNAVAKSAPPGNAFKNTSLIQPLSFNITSDRPSNCLNDNSKSDLLSQNQESASACNTAVPKNSSSLSNKEYTSGLRGENYSNANGNEGIDSDECQGDGNLTPRTTQNVFGGRNDFKNTLAPIIKSQLFHISQQQQRHLQSLKGMNLTNHLSFSPNHHFHTPSTADGGNGRSNRFYQRIEHAQTSAHMSCSPSFNSIDSLQSTAVSCVPESDNNNNNDNLIKTPQHSYNIFSKKSSKGAYVIPNSHNGTLESGSLSSYTYATNNNPKMLLTLNQQHSLNNGGASNTKSELHGIGRIIPIKQGWLYKKSTKGLNKEWKKKYVILNSNGILVYHQSVQDYVNNQDGKEIPLLHTTVKVPGQHQQIQIVNSRNSTINFTNAATSTPRSTSHHSNLNNSLAEDFTKISLGSNSSVSQSFIKRLNNNIQQHLSPALHHHHYSQNSTDCVTDSSHQTSIAPKTPTTSTHSSNTINDYISMTPLTKKKHKRNKSGENECEFTIVSLDNKQWHFSAQTSQERQEWVKAIEAQILSGLSDLTSARNIPSNNISVNNNTSQLSSLLKGNAALTGQVLVNSNSDNSSFYHNLVDSTDAANSSTHNHITHLLPIDIVNERLCYIKSHIPGNTLCVDCRSPNPEWASLNLGALMCIECSGIHRNLGVHISKIRSLQLDDWPSEYLSLLLHIGNDTCNKIYEAQCSKLNLQKPSPTCTREDKEKWIRAKYELKQFIAPLNLKTNQQYSENLIRAVICQDIATVMLILAHLSLKNVIYNKNDNNHSNNLKSKNGDNNKNLINPEEIINARNTLSGESNKMKIYLGKTALHIAALLGNVAIVQLLLWNDANSCLKDSDGLTPLDIAKKIGHKDCIYVLMKRMKKN